MSQQRIMPKRALISVSDKSGITEFAKALNTLGVEIISTGGTANHLKTQGVHVTEVASVTQFPEIMGGRVKTLHPNIFAAILGRRDLDSEVAREHDIDWIDMVICNLYPFAETIQKPNATLEQAIENIDIGGPSMLRAAAKNMAWTTVVIDPNDYPELLKMLATQGGIDRNERQRLATKAFAHTAAYDSLITRYLEQHIDQEEPAFSDSLSLSGNRTATLRYGENPSQQAAAYADPLNHNGGILQAKQLQGKALSYNNILDGDGALNCLLEFDAPACVVVKHNNPCGAATAETIEAAFQSAWEADSLSAFGGIVALNRRCNVEIAEFLSGVFFELLIAPDYEPEALKLLAKKSNLRLLQLDTSRLTKQPTRPLIRSIRGGWLLQSESFHAIASEQLTNVTQQQANDEQIAELLFAWQVVKHVKSNAIVITQNRTTLGIGCGQVSRVDAVDLAIHKAKQTQGAVLASDAFFPFRDSIDRLAEAGIKAIIQPGGSVRDDEVIAACNEHNIAMLFTGERCFRH